ncbi:MAG: alpha/beta hydrolase [Pseudomonadales bacterium]
MKKILCKLVATLASVAVSGLTIALEQKNESLTRQDGSTINYYVDRDESRQSQPLLVVIQGSDCNSIVWNPSIEQYTAAAPNHAILLVEKYGITNDLPWADDEGRADCPTEYLRNNTLEQRVSDYTEVISKLRHDASWWNGKLVILAGSSGTSVGERLATILPETECLIIFGFGSRWFENDVLGSVRSSLVSAGLKNTELEREYNKIAAIFNEVQKNPTPNKTMSGHSYAWWASAFKFDQFMELKNVSVPILAIQGSNDQSVSAEGAREMIQALKRIERTNITYKEYEGLNHGFVDGSGQSHKSEVIADIRRWLKSRH